MALVKCSECGKDVSDKAQTCPHCGNPMSPVPPAPPMPPMPPTPGGAVTGTAPQSTAPQVGIDTQKLKCPYCGEMLGPKDILSSGWAKCPSCKQSIRLTGANGEYDDNVLIERILPFNFTIEEYHRIFMQHIMNHDGQNAFERMKTVSIKRKYIWVREFGRANERALYPMCQYGKDVFIKMCDTPYMLIEDYEKFFPTDKMVQFNSEDIRDTEVLAKELSAAECKHEFSHTDVGKYDPTPNYYCLPFIEEIVELDGQEYTFIGTAGANDYRFNVGNYPFTAMPQPKYTEMRPVSITLAVVACILIAIPIIAGFIESFWGTLIVLVILGVIGFALSGLLAIAFTAVAAIPMGIDIGICKIINSNRRKTFRANYEALQKAKQQSARSRMKAELTYDIPEFPIP